MHLSSPDFFQTKLLPKKIFQEHYKYMSVKQLGLRSGPTVVGPDLGPNCLQML